MNNKKKLTRFKPQIRTRHITHKALNESNALPLFKFRSVIRFGSITEFDDTPDKGGNRIEINTVQSVKNSSNKLLMKKCFVKAGVKTADWWTHNTGINFACQSENTTHSIDSLPYPIVAKHIYGSRGTGNTLINNVEELNVWLEGKTKSNYIFEKYYNFNREYRLHVTKNGCFYTCRKMLKSDVPQDKRWFRNDSNSVWIIEENEKFDKPSNWNDIVSECVKALDSIGADVAAFDVKVQSAFTSKDKIREYPDFIIIESNTAPSFGDITLQKYKQILPVLLQEKYELNKTKQVNA